MTIKLAAFLFSVILPFFIGAQQDKVERELAQIHSLIDRAGQLYQAADYKQCVRFIVAAQRRMEALIDGASADLLNKLQEDYDRVERAHGLLHDQGQTLPDLKPLRQAKQEAGNPFGDRPSGSLSPGLPAPSAPTQPNRADAGDPSSGTAAGEKLVSFSKDVQPLLERKCGRCHIERNLGKLSMKSHGELMKGADGSPVVVQGKPDESRMIQSVEDGDMPQGNITVSKRELETLKQWIAQGAKDDTPQGGLKSFR